MSRPLPPSVEKIALIAANGVTSAIRAQCVRDAYLLGYLDGTVAELRARIAVENASEPPELEPYDPADHSGAPENVQ